MMETGTVKSVGNSMSDTYEWVCCPNCESRRVTVDRRIGDRGGTEALNIGCEDCNETRTVIP